MAANGGLSAMECGSRRKCGPRGRRGRAGGGGAREEEAASENDKVPDVTEKIARARIGLGALAARTGSRNGRAR